MTLKKKYVNYLRELQESRRQGRKPPEDPDEKENRRKIEKELLKSLRSLETEQDVRAVLIDFGLQAGSKQLEMTVQAWRLWKRTL